MMPLHSVGVPRLAMKGFRTGLLDIVELRIAKPPIAQSVRKIMFRLLLISEGNSETCLNFQ